MRSFTLFGFLLCLFATLALALPEAASVDDLEARDSSPSVSSGSGKYQPYIDTDLNPLAAASAKLKATCPAGTRLCSTGACCPLRGGCCKNKKCCKSGSWCYGKGCCPNNYNGCDGKGCCAKGWNCCKGGSCCQKGYYCYKSRKYNKIRCCPKNKVCA